jgi:hypothetical protein
MRAALHSLWAALLCCAVGACSVAPLDLAGLSCPCAPDYTCLHAKCVKKGQGGGSGGTSGTAGTAGSDHDSGAGGTGGPDRDSGGGHGGDSSITFRDAELPDTGMGFDASLTFDAGPMCPAVAPSGACPSGCSRCEGQTCIIDCDYPYACGLVMAPCPPGWGCTVICSGPGACAAPFSMECSDGPCLLQCGVSTCLGAKIDCGTGACEVRCEGGASPPAVNCGSACSCNDGC